MSLDQQSLRLHKKYKGKLVIASVLPIKSRRDLSLAYTPGVAAVSRAIARNPSSVFDYTVKSRMVAVVTDGSAVLGLGNIGPLAALPVMEGKAILFKEFAGIDAFPIALATQDVEEVIKTVKMIAPGFGGINLEDISAPRCFEIEERLVNELDIPVFHDDQHGTAIVVLAGLLNAAKLVNKKLSEMSIVINGAGAAGIATANLLANYGVGELVVLDSQGAIYEGRGGLHKYKLQLAKKTNQRKKRGNLGAVIKGADAFIGVSKADILKPAMIKIMARSPIVFAMANPTPEIMPDAAKKAGVAIVATGRSDFPNQINNVLAFPGVFKGLMEGRIRRVTNDMKTAAAKALAAHVKKLTKNQILPSPLDKKVSEIIASSIKKHG